MANVLVNDSSLSAIGAAIRAKNGSSDTYKPGDMAAAIAAIPDLLDLLNTNDLTEFRSARDEIRDNLFNGEITGTSTVTKGPELRAVTLTSPGKEWSNLLIIRRRAFRECRKLTTLTANPEAKIRVMEYAFENAVNLATINAAIAEIFEGAFKACVALKSFDFSSAQKVGNYAFQSSGLEHLNATVEVGSYSFAGSKLQDVVLTIPESSRAYTVSSNAFNGCPNLVSVTVTDTRSSGDKNVAEYAFAVCESLVSVTLTGVTNIGSNVFNGCVRLASLEIPDVRIFAGNAIYGCAALTHLYGPKISQFSLKGATGCGVVSANVPGATTISAGAFYNMSQLRAVKAGACTSIGNSTSSSGKTFYLCDNLAVLLPGSTMATLASSQNIPATVTFYVNDSLYETYKEATNWTAIQSQIAKYSDCPAAILAYFEGEE